MRTPGYLRFKARNLARVVIDGKTIYLGPYGSPESFQKYERVIAEWKARQGQPAVTCLPVTVSDLIARFWTHAKTHYKKPDGSYKSEFGNYRYVLRPLKALYGPTKLADFGPLALKAYRVALATGWTDPERGPQKGIARKYVNRCVVRVRTMFRWAESEELIAGGTFHRLRTVGALKPGEAGARETAPVTAAPEESVTALLTAWSLAGKAPVLNHVARAALETQLLTAARPGEVLGLRVGDLRRDGRADIDGVTLDARGLWVAVLSSHKTAHLGHSRVLLFGPRCQEVLRPLVEGREDHEYVFRPADAVAEMRRRRRAMRQTPVQPSQRDRSRDRPLRTAGERYTATAYCHALTAACLRAGIPHFHPHQIRHSACSRLGAEFGPELARIVLGHAGLSATKIYLHADLSKAVEAMRRVG